MFPVAFVLKDFQFMFGIKAALEMAVVTTKIILVNYWSQCFNFFKSEIKVSDCEYGSPLRSEGILVVQWCVLTQAIQIFNSNFRVLRL